MESLTSRMLGTAATHHMWQPGDRILIALSGGPDSVALLHALCEVSRSEELILRALHVDYGLRGLESTGDVAFCMRLCANLGVPLVVHTPASAPHGNLQDWARRERQSAWSRCLREDELDSVAVAHTANDRAETFILQLFRGAGPDTPGHMRPVSGRVIRPLLELSRRDVLGYLSAQRRPFRIDRSNRSAAYRRNRVRHELLPLAAQIFDCDAVELLNHQAELVALDAEFLQREAEALCRTSERRNHEIRIATSTLHGQPEALQLRALRRLAADLGAKPGRSQSLRLLRLAHQLPGRRIDLDAGVWAERGRDAIWIYRVESPRPSTPVAIPGATALPDGTRLCVEPAGTAPPYPDGRRHARMALPVDRSTWAVRAACAGDRMRPFGMRGSRLVFDLLAEAGVPRHRRNHAWVLTDGEQIFWLLGHRQAESGRVTPAQPAVYELSWNADA